MLNENEKIIKICYQASSLDKFDTYKNAVFIVNKDLETNKNSVILIQPVLVTKDYKDVGLRLAKVLATYNNEEEFAKDYDDTSIDNINKPFFVCNINLEPYYESVKSCTRKLELEKQMKKAASKLEDIAKYKALADLDASFKPLYEEYLNICKTENQTLLEASKE